MASVLRHLLESLEPRAHHLMQPGPFDLQIMGDAAFVAAVRSALDLLQQNCPDYYNVVAENVAVIEPAGRGTGRKHQELPRIALESSPGSGTDLAPHSKAVWYAGIIARETYRSKCFRDRLRNATAPGSAADTPASGSDASCLQIQLETLRKMNAPQWMLDYVGSQR